jgi:sulfur-oxidizing protein SoxY
MRRRRVLGGGLSLVALALAPAARAVIPDDVAAAIRRRVGDVDALEGGFVFDLPENIENGAFVPFSVEVDSPMTPDDHVVAVHLFATRNPTPEIASFVFTPRSGRAAVQSRLRLAEDQTVLAYAVFSDGRVRRAAAAAEVAIGGCVV